MRYTGRKGWQASYKDTFDFEYSLSPIIHAALVKFREQMDDEWFGVPSKIIDYCGYTIGETSEDELQICSDKWKEIVDKMIYAFDKDSEPNIEAYNFEFVRNPDHGERTGESSSKWSMSPDNQSEYDRYREDEKLYWERKDEGLELFGKFYTCLWW